MDELAEAKQKAALPTIEVTAMDTEPKEQLTIARPFLRPDGLYDALRTPISKPEVRGICSRGSTNSLHAQMICE